MKKIRIGIVGAGEMADRLHLPWIKAIKNCEPRAICRRNLGKAGAIAEKHGVPMIFSDYKEMIKSASVDAVIISSPNNLHSEMALYAMKNKKHVLVEKPMALTIKDLGLMIKAARKNKVILMAEHPLRFDPYIEKMRELVAAGRIGRVLGIRGRHSHSGPEYWSKTAKWYMDEKSGGGALHDLGIHIYDTARHIINKEAVRVSCVEKTIKKKARVNDNAVFTVEFKDGGMGVFEASWTGYPPEFTLSIYGDRGSIFYTHGNHSLKLELWDPENAKKPFTFIQPKVALKQRYQNPVAYFAQCVARHKTPFIDGVEAAKSTAVIIASHVAARTGRPQAAKF
jgi:UDP-N-acetylglucosamine 3-dehydrogenase